MSDKCCNNCQYLAGPSGKTCIWYSLIDGDWADFNGVEGYLITDFQPSNPEETFCEHYA